MSVQKFPTPPSSFVFCQVQGCPLASTCLRAKALPYADPEANSIFCVNSNAHAAIGTDKCPQFKKIEIVPIAYGFMNILSAMSVSGANAAKFEIICKYNTTQFYRWRKDAFPIPPKQQKILTDIFVSHGAKEPVTFDRYENTYEWN